MASDPHLPTGACAAASPTEPLAGAALPGVEFWILLEHYAPWAPKALDSDGLDEATRAGIRRAMERLPAARFQLIRRPERARVHRPFLFLGRSGTPESWMIRIELESTARVAELDLAAILESGEHPGALPLTDPLFLVCAHGRRDRCCGLLGVPLFRSMAGENPGALDVWQSSHVGGHRFAPNVQILPQGLIYGRVQPTEGPALLDAHRRGKFFDLERLRGRMLFEQPVQAAEVFLRRAGELTSPSGPTLIEHAEIDGGVHRVRFESDGSTCSIAVRRIELDLPPRPFGCADEPTPVLSWQPVVGGISPAPSR